MTSVTVQAQPEDLDSAPRTIGALEVTPLSSSEWRVRNIQLPEDDGRSVLGVVQLIGNTYEVMQIGVPLARYYFTSLEDAVEYLGGAT